MLLMRSNIVIIANEMRSRADARIWALQKEIQGQTLIICSQQSASSSVDRRGTRLATPTVVDLDQRVRGYNAFG
jgi:hypothetical protein